MAVNYLRQIWPEAERRALAGVLDKGDVINVPLTCLEIKGDRSMRISAWQLETLAEQRNAGAELAVLIVRVDRKAVKDWDFYMPLGHLVALGVTDMEGRRPWVRMSFSAGVKLLETLIAMHSL